MKRQLILWIALILSQIVSAAQQYTFSNLSVKDGLSQLQVTSIYQDQQGFMWFGTRNGLNKFNGYSFEKYWNHSDDPQSISSNSIVCITEDAHGCLWVGTEDGLNRLDKSRRSFQRYYYNRRNNTANNKILSLYIDHQQTLWVGTVDGLFVYNPTTDALDAVPIKEFIGNSVRAITAKDNLLYLASSANGLLVYDPIQAKTVHQYKNIVKNVPASSNFITTVHIDKKGNIWLGSYQDGIFVIQPETTEVIHYNTSNGLSDNHIRCISESPAGEMWVGTFDGLNIINPVTQRILSHNSGKPYAIRHHSICSILFDRTSTVWVGSYAGGVDYSTPYSHPFEFYNPEIKLNANLGILGTAVEYNNTLYICSEGGGLITLDLQNPIFQQYTLHRTSGKSIFKTIYADGNRILCGTNQGEIYAFDPFIRQFSLFYQTKQGPIYHISQNRAGEYVIGCISQNGLIFLSHDKRSIQAQFPVDNENDVTFPQVICVCEIDNDVYLIGTKSNGLFYYDRTNRSFISYKHTHELPAASISSILKDRSGKIWISSNDGGVYEFDSLTGKFNVYNESNGLISNHVCKIVESDDNTLWFSTLNGLSNLDLRTRNIVNYDHEDGIYVEEFSPCAGTRLSNNWIFFAGNNGFTIFHPNNILTNPNAPPIILNKLYINNELVQPCPDGILKESISTQKKIVLKHDQTNITIEYCALNYIFNNKNQYMYKLEGFDKDWNKVEHRRTAYYTNIPAGTYHFIVKGSNNNGMWNEKGTTLEIVVLPPLWKTWWAYLIYCIIIIASITFIIHYFIEKKFLKNSILLKQKEAEMHEAYYQERNQLFTNFSHELRTPLTLIIAPLEDFVKRTELPDDILYKSGLMLRNTQRMLRIVNNLMDLQKNESGNMKLQVSENDIVRFTHEAIAPFRDLALCRSIHLQLKQSVNQQLVWFDWNLLEKVYFNFLSNAFKNVPDGGSIVVDLSVKSLDELAHTVPAKYNHYTNAEIKYFAVSIQDTGVGIAPDELEKIFRPFYQVAQNEHSNSGTGIGLSLSKAIIEMHHGIVWAESAPGAGATFKFILPINKSEFAEESIVDAPVNDTISFNVDLPETVYEAEKSPDKQINILVVEDNRDLNNYICSCLSDKYNVTSAKNGEDALFKAINTLPDLIITDLMMPKMDGIELIRKLRENTNTSHIPIIMVTAKTGTDDIREGYSAGADEYITKPFSASILKIRVDNLILSREKLKEVYSKNFSLKSLGMDTTSVDEKFMQKLYALLQQNIGNSDLNLDDYSKELGISKSNLYRKIKQITGYPPHEFIRNFRLETAAKMLKETDMTVTDVYCAVGYNSLAHFSNCFKAVYGVSPTKFKNKKEEVTPPVKE